MMTLQRNTQARVAFDQEVAKKERKEHPTDPEG